MARGPIQGQQQQITRTTVEQQTIKHTGPLPHPDVLAGYDQVVPGAAERIIALMEGEGKHRRELEKAEAEHFHRAQMAQITIQGRGQLFGLLVAIAGFALAGFAILHGHPWTSATIASVDLVGLVTVFVTGVSRGKAPKDSEETKDLARTDK